MTSNEKLAQWPERFGAVTSVQLVVFPSHGHFP